MKKLAGKIALVTGGSEGMGFDTAQEFIKEGAIVYITGRRTKTLENAASRLGKSTTPIVADSSNLADLDRVFDEIKQVSGKLDIVFANAGIYKQVPFEDVDEEFYYQYTDVNIKGVFFTVQKAVPLMNSSGSIILNGSFIGSSGFAGMSIYGATKAAVRSFARTMTAELKGKGPRVNVISPGPIDTAGNADMMGKNLEVRQQVMSMVPREEIGSGLDVARAAVFLASEDSRYIAGVELFVDGGINAV